MTKQDKPTQAPPAHYLDRDQSNPLGGDKTNVFPERGLNTPHGPRWGDESVQTVPPSKPNNGHNHGE